MLDVLRSAIRALGFSYNEVGAKLGVSNGYLSRLFSGKIDLKFDHIVEISRALGFEPEEMVHLAYPQPRTPPSQSAARYQELMGGAVNRAARPHLPPDLPSAPEEMDALVAQSLQRLLAVPAPRPATTEEDVEKIVERMLRKFFGDLAQAKAQGE